MQSSQEYKILIIKPSAFGDVVQMLQVAEGLYRKAEKSGIYLDIHWIIRDCFAEFLRLSPVISKLFIFERHGGIRSFLRLIKEVRARRYDYLIDGQGLLRTGLMTFFAKATEKIGRGNAREGSRFFYQKNFMPTFAPFHEVDILQSLLTPLGLNSQPQRPLTLKVQSWHFPFEKGSILLFPNSGRVEKEWPFFPELTRLLLEQTPYRCVWIGQRVPEDVPQHPRFTNFIGQTRLSDLPMLIQSARCVVANDSGPVHLAAALKKPLVGIYGPTSGQRSGPYPTAEHCIFQATNGNLKNISPEAVAEAVLRQIEQST